LHYERWRHRLVTQETPPERLQRTDETQGETTKRRWFTTLGVSLCILAVVAATVVTALLLTSDERDSSASSEGRQDDASMVTIEAGAYDWGVYLGVDVTFDSQRGLDDGYFQAGDMRYPVHFWTSATDDDYGQSDLIPAHPGERVLIEVTDAIPDCSVDPAASLDLHVTSQMPDGTRHVDRFTVSNREAYADAVADWCASGVRVMTGNASITTDGIATVKLLVTNPGPKPVSVQAPALSAEGAHWQAASLTVAPQTTATLVLHGTRVNQNASQPVPWADGRLLIDGKPFHGHLEF
jgi:hypothetical protein